MRILSYIDKILKRWIIFTISYSQKAFELDVPKLNRIIIYLFIFDKYIILSFILYCYSDRVVIIDHLYIHHVLKILLFYQSFKKATILKTNIVLLYISKKSVFNQSNNLMIKTFFKKKVNNRKNYKILVKNTIFGLLHFKLILF